MKRHPVLQRGPRFVQQLGGGEDIAHEPVTLLTEAEACAHVKVFNARKHPVRQFADWARRAGVPVKRVGRARLYDRRVLEAFLDQRPWTKRHRSVA